MLAKKVKFALRAPVLGHTAANRKFFSQGDVSKGSQLFTWMDLDGCHVTSCNGTGWFPWFCDLLQALNFNLPLSWVVQEAIDFFYGCGLMPEFWSSPGMFFCLQWMCWIQPRQPSNSILTTTQKKGQRFWQLVKAWGELTWGLQMASIPLLELHLPFYFSLPSSSHVIHVRNSKRPVRI